MTRFNHNAYKKVGRVVAGWLLPLCILVTSPFVASAARDLLPQKKQEITQSGEVNLQPLDQEHWQRPQSFFKWIAMACGWKVPDDSLGREGWYLNPRIEPKVPGVSVFPPDTTMFYIVYEIPSLDAPMQMNADWFVVNEEGQPVGKPVGHDAQFLDMNEAYGYFELRKPDHGWSPGTYLVKIYVSSPGQQRHALSVAGTMKFNINASEEAARTGERCRRAGPQTDYTG